MEKQFPQLIAGLSYDVQCPPDSINSLPAGCLVRPRMLINTVAAYRWLPVSLRNPLTARSAHGLQSGPTGKD